MALQETHWQESTEFEVEGWRCISSAHKSKDRAPKAKSSTQPPQPAEGTSASQRAVHDDKRADGVMLLISPHVAKVSIRWSEYLKGRVLEGVFQWRGARVHVISVYQHVWSTSKTSQQNREDRAPCLEALSKAIRSAPMCDTLIVLGDFNSTLNTSHGTVGTCTPGPPPHRATEDAYFQRLFRDMDW